MPHILVKLVNCCPVHSSEIESGGQEGVCGCVTTDGSNAALLANSPSPSATAAQHGCTTMHDVERGQRGGYGGGLGR